MDKIVNRVANSKLITIDLEDWYVEGTRTVFDISNWLFEGLLLREKEFRSYVEAHDWSQYRNHFIALTCSTDAIIPGWAFMLVTTAITPYAKRVVVGDLEQLETLLYEIKIASIKVEKYTNKPIIIKGCSHKPVPKNAYISLIQKLQPIAKSIMYGEACSSVPLFKRKK